MSTENKKCMVCAKTVTVLKGGICEACQERIRREAMGEQAREMDNTEKELARQGVPPTRRPGK
jgi:hypothetical protein